MLRKDSHGDIQEFRQSMVGSLKGQIGVLGGRKPNGSLIMEVST